jgi:glutaredoxin
MAAEEAAAAAPDAQWRGIIRPMQGFWSRSQLALVWFVLALAASASSLSACKKAVPEAPPVLSQGAPPLDVKAEGKWLYTYADDAGHFVTTDDPKKVPETSRRVVRVLDPAANPAAPGSDPGKVYVIDLAELEKKGKVVARPLSREAFETGALSQLSPGESSAFPGGPGAGAGEPSGEAPAGSGEPTAAAPTATGTPVVTLYGASWCGACKQARAYLRSRRIPFADRDIERDQAAARELREKAQRLGVGADRIPVLDVRGRLLIGFDRARLEALLGEAT